MSDTEPAADPKATAKNTLTNKARHALNVWVDGQLERFAGKTWEELIEGVNAELPFTVTRANLVNACEAVDKQHVTPNDVKRAEKTGGFMTVAEQQALVEQVSMLVARDKTQRGYLVAMIEQLRFLSGASGIGMPIELASAQEDILGY